MAGSHVLEAKIPMIFDRNFKLGFKIKLHKKDIKNSLVAATELQIPLPLTGLIEQILSALIVDSKGMLVHSAIIQFAEKLAMIEVRKDV